MPWVIGLRVVSKCKYGAPLIITFDIQHILKNDFHIMTAAIFCHKTEQDDILGIFPFAFMVLISLPVIIAYLFLQKYFIEGLMAGSGK